MRKTAERKTAERKTAERKTAERKTAERKTAERKTAAGKVRAEDGCHLTQAADAGQIRSCEVCHQELGSQQWWVTRYPSGVHTRCREWSEVAFPYARHLSLLRRMRFSLDGDAQRLVVLADNWLGGMERGWPTPGADGVLKGALLLRRLRSKLAALNVEPRLTNQL